MVVVVSCGRTLESDERRERVTETPASTAGKRHLISTLSIRNHLDTWLRVNPPRRGVHHWYARRTTTPSRGNIPFLLRAGHRRNDPSLKPLPLYRRRSTNVAQDSTVSSKAVTPISTSSSNDVPLHAEQQWGASTRRIRSATRAHMHKLCTLRGAFTDLVTLLYAKRCFPYTESQCFSHSM